MAPLPLVKLFVLAVKQLSKPVATRISAYAMTHPVSRARLIAFAQMTQRVEVAMQRSAEGKEGKAFVGRLTDEMAIKRASSLVAEGTVYGIAAALVVFEVHMNSKSNAEKEASARRQRQQLDERLTRLEDSISRLQTELRCVFVFPVHVSVRRDSDVVQMAQRCSYSIVHCRIWVSDAQPQTSRVAICNADRHLAILPVQAAKRARRAEG